MFNAFVSVQPHVAPLFFNSSFISVIFKRKYADSSLPALSILIDASVLANSSVSRIPYSEVKFRTRKDNLRTLLKNLEMDKDYHSFHLCTIFYTILVANAVICELFEIQNLKALRNVSWNNSTLPLFQFPMQSTRTWRICARKMWFSTSITDIIPIPLIRAASPIY